MHRNLLDSFRAEAIREVLESSEPESALTFFVGSSALVEGLYEVHPVIGVPRARWASKPTLTRTRIGRQKVMPSFQHALMEEVLGAATADLNRRIPPEDFSVRWSDRSELIEKRREGSSNRFHCSADTSSRRNWLWRLTRSRRSRMREVCDQAVNCFDGGHVCCDPGSILALLLVRAASCLLNSLSVGEDESSARGGDESISKFSSGSQNVSGSAARRACASSSSQPP